MLNRDEKIAYQLLSKESGQRSQVICQTLGEAAEILGKGFSFTDPETGDPVVQDASAHYLLVLMDNVGTGEQEFSRRPLLTVADFLKLVKEATANG